MCIKKSRSSIFLVTKGIGEIVPRSPRSATAKRVEPPSEPALFLGPAAAAWENFKALSLDEGIKEHAEGAYPSYPRY